MRENFQVTFKSFNLFLVSAFASISPGKEELSFLVFLISATSDLLILCILGFRLKKDFHIKTNFQIILCIQGIHFTSIAACPDINLGLVGNNGSNLCLLGWFPKTWTPLSYSTNPTISSRNKVILISKSSQWQEEWNTISIVYIFLNTL